MSFPFPRPFPGPSMVSWGVLSLFSSGEQGAWYDPSDFSTMFQDSAGTTPVTAVEQPVGLILDKSKGLALGSELVTNGGFDTDTNWTKGADWTITGGSAVKVAGASTSTVYQSVTVTAGKSYKITVVVSANNNAGVLRADFRGTTTVSSSTFTGTGTFTTILTAATGNNEVHIVGQSVEAATIDSISVKELAGNHASQSTAASRPVLSARVNLLTYTEQFDNGVWAKYNATTTADTTAAPNESTTADTLTGTADATQHLAYRQYTAFVNATNYQLSVYGKAGTNNFLYLGAQSFGGATFDLANGVVGSNTGGGSGSIQNIGNGWYRCIVSVTATGTSSQLDVGVAPNGTSPSGVGSAPGTIYIWGADLRVTNVGVGLPAYQRVGAAVTATTNPAVTGVPDYDTSGFPLYLKFDGVDDSLATGTIDPGSVDKAQVFAGVRKLSDAATGTVVQLSSSTSTNDGTFGMYAPFNPGAAADYAFISKGTVRITVDSDPFVGPESAVLAGLGNISGPTATLRRNGTQIATSSSSQGTGNFGSFALNLGTGAGALNGQVYSMILRFSAANLSDAQIASTETYVNSKTGAY